MRLTSFKAGFIGNHDGSNAFTIFPATYVTLLLIILVFVDPVSGGRSSLSPSLSPLSFRRYSSSRLKCSDAKSCYQLGYYGSQRSKIRTDDGSRQRLPNWISRHLDKLITLNRQHLPSIRRIIYVLLFSYFSFDSLTSIWQDEWAAERSPETIFNVPRALRWQYNTQERDVVKRRVFKDRTIRKLVGAGYTPRLVFLFGIMLRGFIHCTAIPKIFQPPIGWGAGSVIAAKFCCREWLPTILLGWFGSQYYWRLFGINGPPKNHPPDDPFYGFPITIHKVKF